MLMRAWLANRGGTVQADGTDLRQVTHACSPEALWEAWMGHQKGIERRLERCKWLDEVAILDIPFLVPDLKRFHRETGYLNVYHLKRPYQGGTRMSCTAASVEVLVIGGGVIGSSIAYHVARQGRSVLVVERNEIVEEPAASWASAGGIRLWEQDLAEAPLAHVAIERWPTLA